MRCGRAGRELLFVLSTVVFAVFGPAFVVGFLTLGTFLSVTAIGVPLLAAGLLGARRLGGVQRGLAAALLGERIEEPPPPRDLPGFYGRVQSLLTDPHGWRAVAFYLLQPPQALLQAATVVFTWCWGAVALTHPLQRALGWNQTREGWSIAGYSLEPFPRPFLVSLAGLALLWLAPRAVRLALLPNRLLMRWLLGPHRPAARIRDLEESRALVVDESAAVLRRIERDLHDGAQARMVSLIMQLTLLKETVPEGPARQLAAQAQDTASQAVRELRELVRGLHPPVLDQGLEAALAALADTVPLRTELRVEVPRLRAAVETIAYFCVAELLTNAVRHSGADEARVSAVLDGGLLRVEVEDDGRGGATALPGSGLSGLRERVGAVDGRLLVHSPAGGPTRITVELPANR
ncbi:sensor domain-containing protein [Actinocorallia sp. B10E7]|uniref:sensor histidine kinase n=1 Tax=Actinocorallia sp. B10E7 TaxID=3153558 RepID=UPI00325C7FE6